MEIVDERETQKATTKRTNKDKKEQGVTEARVKGSEIIDFVVHLI